MEFVNEYSASTPIIFHNPNMDNHEHEEEESIVAETGIFPLGGPGAYLIEGKSGSGKNVLLEYFLSKCPLPFDNVVSLSTTQEETGSLDFIERLYDTNRWGIAKSVDDLMHVIKVRKECLAKYKKALGTEARDSFVYDHPILMIVDDIGGTTNTRQSEKNPWYTLFTTVRHLGIYLVVLVQYHKQIGPAFMGNTRALVTFDYADDAIKHFASCSGVSLSSGDKQHVQKFLKQRHNFLIWWKNWTAKSNLPDLPWLCEKINTNQGSSTINYREYYTGKKTKPTKRKIIVPEDSDEDDEDDEMSLDDDEY